MNKHVFQSLAARAVALAGSLSITVMSARLLGPEGKGHYAFLVAMIGLSMQAGTLGMGTSNLYFSSRDKARAGALITNTAILAAVVSTVIYGLIIIFRMAGIELVPYSQGTLLLVCLAVCFGLVWVSGQNLLVGLGLIGSFNALSILYSVLLSLLLAWVFASGDPSIALMAGAQVACYVVAVAALLVCLTRRAPGKLQFDRGLLSTSMKYGLTVYLAQTVSFLATRIDLIVVQQNLPVSDLGNYSLASDFCNVIVQFQAAVNLLVFARLSTLKESQQRRHVTYTILKNSAIFLVVALPIGALILRPVVVAVFGEAFAPATTAILLLMPGAAFLALASILQNHLGAIGRPHWMFVAPASACVVSLMLNLNLVPRLGMAGAAIGSTAGYAAMFGAAIFLVIRLERSKEA